jgi:hypothetical protein
MDPKDRLQAGRDAADRRDYESALREYVWFHHHALEADPAYAGVRLSYALSDWIALAAHYPPALVELRRIRDEKVRALRAGEGSPDLFHDVSSINEYLHERDATHVLFRELATAQPELARECADVALPDVVRAGDYALAREYLPERDAHLSQWSEFVETMQKHMPAIEGMTADAMIDAQIDMYLQQVQPILTTLFALGEKAEAAEWRSQAVSAIKDAAARERVQAKLIAAPAA